MSHFFDVLSVDQVIEILKTKRKTFDEKIKDSNLAHEELVPLTEADNRVLARDIRAREDLPLTARSAMDGFALHANDTFGASDSNPVFLENVMNFAINEIPSGYLQRGQCAGIVTGGIPPNGADAVIMVEYTEELGDNLIEIHRSVAPNEHLMLQGEDVKANTIALTAGTFLKAQEIGLLAALGVCHVPVLPRLSVAILSTGDEIVPIEEKVCKGQVRDVNSYTLAALIKKAGAEAYLYGIIDDNLQNLQSKLEEIINKKHDIILLSGGSSVGIRDFTIKALEQIQDCTVFCHGIAMSPGKPVIFAQKNNTLICGLPGQVTSAQIVVQRLIIPFIHYLTGKEQAFDQNTWHTCIARLERNVASRQGREDYIRVALYKQGNIQYAKPILGHSGLLRTLTKSDGMIKIDAACEGIEQGAKVRVFLFD